MADDSNRSVPTIPRASGSITVPIPAAKTMVSGRFDVMHHEIPGAWTRDGDLARESIRQSPEPVLRWECSTLGPHAALVLGIILLLAGVFLYASSGALVTVYTVTADSYWTYYEFQHNTHYEYQCVGLGVNPLCTFFFYLAYAGAVSLSSAGAVLMAVSLNKLIEVRRLQ
jgi:hypothetical protein